MIFKSAQVFVMSLCHIHTYIYTYVYIYAQKDLFCLMTKDTDKREWRKETGTEKE